MNNKLQYPPSLPKNTPITSIITDHFHRKVYTGGSKLAINKARDNRYWVINYIAAMKITMSNRVAC